MKVVGIRELKDRLSEYVRLVRAGEDVLLTDRGEVVAELCRTDKSTLVGRVDPGLAALASNGAIAIGAANAPELYPSLSGLLAGRSVLDLLAEERGEG